MPEEENVVPPEEQPKDLQEHHQLKRLPATIKQKIQQNVVTFAIKLESARNPDIHAKLAPTTEGFALKTVSRNITIFKQLNFIIRILY